MPKAKFRSRGLPHYDERIGTGVLVDRDREVLTNHHMIRGAQTNHSSFARFKQQYQRPDHWR